MNTIFKDLSVQKQFDRDGYILAPWLGPDEVAALIEFHKGLNLTIPSTFHSTSFLSDLEVKKKINHFVENIFSPKVDSQFLLIKKLGASFLSKPSGSFGDMPVHQDWTIVDESNFSSVTIWVALEDINESKGALQVLPGSHRFSDTLRAPTLQTDYRHLEDYLRSQMITLEMKAGEAIIFDHRLFHASHINTTAQPRLAITYGLTAPEAKLFLYLQSSETKVSKYAMPDDMFLYYHNIGGTPSIGEKIEEFDFVLKPKSSIFFQTCINRYSASVHAERLFKDDLAQAQFEKEGYVLLPALNESEVSSLLAYYHSLKLHDEGGRGFHISMDELDKSLVGSILDKLYEVALPKIESHFVNAKAFVGSFVIKEPNPGSIVPVHQDWSFVENEQKHASLTCWVSLVDTNIDNGALGVIKGSQHFFSNYRPSPSPQVPSPLSEHMFTLFPYLQIIEMKAGEVLIFDNRTFHGSPPNTTATPRIAFGIGMTQKSARLVHYYLNPAVAEKNEVFKYAIDEAFFRKYENSRLAKMYDKGELIEGYKIEARLPYILPQFTVEEITEVILQSGNSMNMPLCEKLALLYQYNMDGTKIEEEVIPQAPVAAQIETAPVSAPQWVDKRSFFQKYTPLNILTELRNRLKA